MLKLTIPAEPGRYAALGTDPRVVRVLALFCGHSRDQAPALLTRGQVMLASFSRALRQGLSEQ